MTFNIFVEEHWLLEATAVDSVPTALLNIALKLHGF